jgi:hypothetical protein
VHPSQIIAGPDTDAKMAGAIQNMSLAQERGDAAVEACPEGVGRHWPWIVSPPKAQGKCRWHYLQAAVEEEDQSPSHLGWLHSIKGARSGQPCLSAAIQLHRTHRRRDICHIWPEQIMRSVVHTWCLYWWHPSATSHQLLSVIRAGDGRRRWVVEMDARHGSICKGRWSSTKRW